MSATRRLSDLAERLAAAGELIEAVGDTGGQVVGGVGYDSRRVAPGSVFVAVTGGHVDGHAYADTAVGAGATAIVAERRIPEAAAPQLIVRSSRRALAEAACWWYGDPSREIPVIGVTGTDGKTTTTFLAAAGLGSVGLRAGLIGSIETRIGGIVDSDHEHQTTPEAPELQAALRAMVAAGDDVAVIEATSHGLALDRVAGIVWDAAILTNVTHEHLELHGTFEAYRDAKRLLFQRIGASTSSRFPPVGIVNVDDPSGPLFASAARGAGASVVTYGLDPAADVRAVSIAAGARGPTFTALTDGWEGPIALQLPGRFNVHNALAVVALGRAWGLDPMSVADGIASVDRVPGRMETIAAGQPFGVVVDFAHSPTSLAAVLDELASQARARAGGAIVVFGSAGERDVEKRPLMGRIAGERSRLVIVTDEDPRGEDGDAILREIAAGAAAAGLRIGEDVLLIRDRRAAIAEAFARARPGDVVLLAGKGHETSIIGAHGHVPWDEATVARQELARQGYGEPG